MLPSSGFSVAHCRLILSFGFVIHKTSNNNDNNKQKQSKNKKQQQNKQHHQYQNIDIVHVLICKKQKTKKDIDCYDKVVLNTILNRH